MKPDESLIKGINRSPGLSVESASVLDGLDMIESAAKEGCIIQVVLMAPQPLVVASIIRFFKRESSSSMDCCAFPVDHLLKYGGARGRALLKCIDASASVYEALTAALQEEEP